VVESDEAERREREREANGLETRKTRERERERGGEPAGQLVECVTKQVSRREEQQKWDL
jgi:hypothetical protein